MPKIPPLDPKIVDDMKREFLDIAIQALVDKDEKIFDTFPSHGTSDHPFWADFRQYINAVTDSAVSPSDREAPAKVSAALSALMEKGKDNPNISAEQFKELLSETESTIRRSAKWHIHDWEKASEAGYLR